MSDDLSSESNDDSLPTESIGHESPMLSECPFCELSDPDVNIVFERELVLFTIAEKYQGALKHSGLIIPKAHRETIFDMTANEIQESFELLSDVKGWLDQQYQPDGYNIGWNCYPVGGQEIMHAHMHVIPRFTAEPMAGKGIRAALKSAENSW